MTAVESGVAAERQAHLNGPKVRTRREATPGDASRSEDTTNATKLAVLFGGHALRSRSQK